MTRAEREQGGKNIAIGKIGYAMIGVVFIGLILAGANTYGTLDTNWLVGNLIFFGIFGFLVFWAFRGFQRQPDSQMRQNWTETRRYLDQGSCPECSSTEIEFDMQDARIHMAFAKCQACGHEWLYTMPPPG